MKLWPHQRQAVDKMRDGSVLVGGTGAGKSYTALVYFYEKVLGGSFDPPVLPKKAVDIYVITTPRKRDENDWVWEATRVGISPERDASVNGIALIVDSWNNIQKYIDIKDAFFIFDEQRAVGKGVWAKSFVKIAKKNHWIMLSATPADQWIDLVPVFLANKFFKNRTAFNQRHVIFAPYTKYPKIIGYRRVDELKALRERIFVTMPFKRSTISHIERMTVGFDAEALKNLKKIEWNPYRNAPIKNYSEYIYLARRIINEHPSRIEVSLAVQKRVKRLIIFYNFNYELYALKNAFKHIPHVSEYNGHKHEPVPTGDEWVYLVQYRSGSEAWECFTTYAMLFYSLNYSYRTTVQAMGRINRLTTTYKHLFYYRLVSKSFLDIAIDAAYRKKRDFNVDALEGELT